jgi:TusA-related sulfurtransferase
MMTDFVDLDVRPILKRGGEPFEHIMAAVVALRPDQGLRLLATFKPTPLLSVLGSRGYTHSAREIGEGDWEVLFTPAPIAVAASAPAADNDGAAQSWPAPAITLDHRDLDPPEPMVRILAALESMRRGEVLAALLCRDPIFLLPELVQRGHAWRGGFEPDGSAYRILVRVGGETRGTS